MKTIHNKYSFRWAVVTSMILFFYFLPATLRAELDNAAVQVAANTFQALTFSHRERPACTGPEGKWRILVDKVLMKHNDWIMTEDHIREIKEAGFNIVSPRKGGTDPERVRRIAALAQKHGLYYVAWMRGSLTTKSGLKYTLADGREQLVYSPNSDEFWEWMTRIILEHAKISLEIPAMIGSFIDFENYSPGKVGNCYRLSYDIKTTKQLAKAKGLKLPELAPAEREPWLRSHGLAEEFRGFQINFWRTKARKLREQIDAINPNYLLIIYPAPGTLFMTEALYLEWATQQAPLVLADAFSYGRNYGRPGRSTLEKDALEANRNGLLARSRFAAKRKIPILYLGGIDPIVPGADPEFSGKNASIISSVTDGYWVFYEGPDYKSTHPLYFEWFKKANEDILSGAYSLPQLPRLEPEPSFTLP